MIAGICFLIYLISYVLFYIGEIKFTNILNVIFLGGMAVFMFLRKKNVSILFVIGAGLLAHFFYVFRNFNLANLGVCIPYLAFFVLFLFYVIPSMSRYADATEKLVYVPGALYLISSIRDWVTLSKMASLKIMTAIVSDYISFSDVILHNIIPDIALAVGFIMAGLWLRETRRSVRIGENERNDSEEALRESKQ